MEKNNWKGWLYLLPAAVFLGLFLVYPLIDVLTYSFEEGYNFASQTYFGTGLYNYRYVLRDPYFLQALKNTLLLVLITVPLSTSLAMLISVGLSSIQKLRIDKGAIRGLQLGGLAADLEDALGIPVDLIPTGSLDSKFLNSISDDEVLLYEAS